MHTYISNVTGLSKRVVSKVCLGDPKGSAASSQGIRGYSPVMATLKSAYFLIKGITVR
jgi:hypothetical protein